MVCLFALLPPIHFPSYVYINDGQDCHVDIILESLKSCCSTERTRRWPTQKSLVNLYMAMENHYIYIYTYWMAKSTWITYTWAVDGHSEVSQSLPEGNSGREPPSAPGGDRRCKRHAECEEEGVAGETMELREFLVGDWRKTHRKTIGQPWEKHRNTMGKP